MGKPVQFLIKDPEHPEVWCDVTLSMHVALCRMFWQQIQVDVKSEDRQEMMEGFLLGANRDLRKLGLADISWADATAPISVPPEAERPEPGL